MGHLEQKNIIPRILRDMNDGVLVLDTRGQILYLNEKGRSMLGLSEDPEGQKYSLTFMDTDADMGDANDAFHQFVLDAVYDKENSHSGEAFYRAGTVEETRRFRLTSSFLYGEDGQERIGIVVVFSDVTEVARLNRQRGILYGLFRADDLCVRLSLPVEPAALSRHRAAGAGHEPCDRGDLGSDVYHYLKDN